MTDTSGFDAWRDAPSAGASDVIGRIGAMDGGIRRLSGRHVAGPAQTVQTAVGDSSTIHRAIASADPGSVLVVDAQGGTARAVWGGIMTRAALERGVVGAVIDGAVRDVDEIIDLGFPIFARATCPGGPHKGFRGVIGVSVQCGGVVVNQGDIVVGDADGVTVVPADRAGEALAALSRLAEREQRWLERIRTGESTVEILGIE